MKIKVKLENCYGIGSLEKEFDFSGRKIFSIYASNGSMKTSFAKTFQDLSRDELTKDEIYQDRETIRDIKKDNQDLNANEVFVVKSYDQGSKPKEGIIATLLVNQKLKQEFDNIYQSIMEVKNEFIEKIKNLSDLSPEKIEKEVCNVFHQGMEGKFFDALIRISHEIETEQQTNFQQIKYNDIFNEKTELLIKNSDFCQNIEKYVEVYNKLLEDSNFFKRGVFNHTQASDIANQLDKNGFFKADHSVLLKNQDKISTKEELERVIEAEKDKILQDEKLKKIFNTLDTKLKKNINLKAFRDCLSNNPQIVSGLLNPEVLKANLLKDYFKEYKDDFRNLVDKYQKSKSTIEKIEQKAKEEKNDWDKVIDEFNRRFFVPFSLVIGNQPDVMLYGEAARIKFAFDGEEIKEERLSILSQGEKRALYILNILFDIEARKKKNEKCLLIIDDIADSFDYKNKYAIVEYLNEISKIDGFYMILLTHNFDFHRTICGRLSMERGNRLNAVRTNQNRTIKIEEDVYQKKNPLAFWRDDLNNTVNLLACIPMIRNLFEFSAEKAEFDKMTEFLHIKEKTKKLQIENLISMYKKKFPSEKTDISSDIKEKNYYDLLISECNRVGESPTLENKVILSIAIRLKAEEFMIQEISDKESIKNITGSQTYKLFEKYKKEFPDGDEKMRILERVNVMTPENIHLNSFMYEPLIDMSIDELKGLYTEVKKL